MTHRRPNLHTPDHDSPIMQRLRASVLARHPIREVTDPAEQARIAAEVEAQAAAKVPLCVITPWRGGSYSSDPLPNRPKPAPHQEPEPMELNPTHPLRASADAASEALRTILAARSMSAAELARRAVAIDPSRTTAVLAPLMRTILRAHRPTVVTVAWPLAAAALGISLADLCSAPDWIAAQPTLSLPKTTPKPTPTSTPLPPSISAYPEDLGDDDHHTPDGPLPSLPFDEDANNPDLDITGHITGIRPRDTLTDVIARTQRAPASTISPVLDPALELGRALTLAVEAAVAAALRSVEARATKAEGAAATAQAQAQALAVQVEILSRRLDRLRDVL